MRPVALVALLPLAAFAQPSTPEPAAPPATPVAAASPALARASSWSLGAGVGVGTPGLAASPVYLSSTLGGLYAPTVPAAVASLERRLSARSWLVLGVNGTYDREPQDLTPQDTGVTKGDFWSLAVSAGVRHVVTPPGAPVDVSFDLVANVGATRWKGDANVYNYGGGPTIAEASFDESGWRAGATFGVAVDRELTGPLSLRVATPIVGAWYTRTRTETSTQPTLDGDEVSAGLALAPRLELRLAF